MEGDNIACPVTLENALPRPNPNALFLPLSLSLSLRAKARVGHARLSRSGLCGLCQFRIENVDTECVVDESVSKLESVRPRARALASRVPWLLQTCVEKSPKNQRPEERGL